MKKYDVAIIGAGPAGLIAAIAASGDGKKVVLIEKNIQLGRKLLATGNGRCNLTNANISLEHYHGSNIEFVDSVIRHFDQRATMEFFENIGLVLKEEEKGRIFPRTNQASSVVEVLRRRLITQNVDIRLDSTVTAIEKAATWQITLADSKQVKADRLIIATGGRAAHQFGSTGDGWQWARKLGHSITFYHAALVPMETVEKWPAEAAGVRVDARVWVMSDEVKIGDQTGDLLFTNYGISGPSVMALARGIAPLLSNSQVEVHIDLFPDFSGDHLEEVLERLLCNSGAAAVEDVLVGLLPSALIPIILGLAEIDPEKVASDISVSEKNGILAKLKDLTLTVAKLRPLKEAQVTAGGLNTEEIDPATLKSKLIDNLYFAGEIIDVDGDSGGYNLQWAWSSGYVAGRSCR